MKRLILVVLLIGLLQSLAYGESNLDLDLQKATLNGYQLLGVRADNRDIGVLLGSRNGFLIDMHNNCEDYFINKGISISYKKVIESVTIYLYKAYHSEGTYYMPYPGRISFGINGDTTIEDLQTYFNGYTQEYVHFDEYTNYILIDLQGHYLFAYFDLKTHKLKKIVLKYKEVETTTNTSEK